MKTRLACCGLMMALIPVGLVAESGPSFDCARASGTVEELICDNAELASLDRELAEAWTSASERRPESEAATARAFQRGWIKGRNECWKETNVEACVRAAYESRITELQVEGGLVAVPDYHSFQCDNDKVLWATFFQNTKLPVAVLTLGGQDQVLAYPERSASGARYEGRNVSFWEHQGEVSLTWMGEETVCRPAGSSPEPGSEDLCAGLPEAASFVVVRDPAAGARVTPTFTVAGCSRTFESNVVWRLLRRNGSVAAEGYTSGGGVDGPGPFTFEVDLRAAEPGLYHLEVSEPVVTEEEGFPPSKTVLPLVVGSE